MKELLLYSYYFLQMQDLSHFMTPKQQDHLLKVSVQLFGQQRLSSKMSSLHGNQLLDLSLMPLAEPA